MKYKGKSINNKSEYLKEFYDKVDTEKNDKLTNAIQFTLDTRKFEIDLYWKRANYFWLYNASAFTAYFYVISNKKIDMQNVLALLITGIGVFLSLCWVLINKASKYWQENWEKHVDLLEGDYMGPLYKTTLEIPWKLRDLVNPFMPIKYSVSKINNLLSFGIFMVWVLLWINCFLSIFQCVSINEKIKAYIVFMATILLLFLLIMFCRTSRATEKTFTMRRTETVDGNHEISGKG